jgi:hypothetical protein
MLNRRFVRGLGIAIVMLLFGWLSSFLIGHGRGRYLIGVIVIALPLVVIASSVAQFNAIQAKPREIRERYKLKQKALGELASALTVMGLAASLWSAYTSIDMLNDSAKYQNYSRAASELRGLLTPSFCESKIYLRLACDQIERTQQDLQWKILENDNVRIASAVSSIKFALNTITSELPEEVLPKKGMIINDLEELVFPSDASRMLFTLMVLSLVLVFATNSISRKIGVATFDVAILEGQDEQITPRKLMILWGNLFKG